MAEATGNDSRENNVLITVSCGTNNPNRSVRAIHLAQVAHSMGKNVAVFLLDEALCTYQEKVLRKILGHPPVILPMTF